MAADGSGQVKEIGIILSKVFNTSGPYSMLQLF